MLEQLFFFFFFYTEMNFFINSNSNFLESTKYFAITVQMKHLRLDILNNGTKIAQDEI